MTQLLDLIRLYVQSAGVQNSIDSGPGREPWVGQPSAGPTAESEWGTTNPAFIPGGSTNPSNCTITRYANGDMLITPNAGVKVMRVTVQSRTAEFGEYASVRFTARYNTAVQTHAVNWFTTNLGRPGSILATGSAGAAPANPASSTEAAYVAHMGAPVALTLSDTPYVTAMLTFTSGTACVPVILRAGTKVYVGPKVMVETPVLRGPAQEVTGDAISIVAQRGLSLKGSTDQLDPGVLKAVIKGAAYEPGVNAALRPGSSVWLVARKTNVGLDTVNGAGSPGPAVWRLIWAGKVLNGDVDYEGEEPRVTIEATDYVADLANIPAPLSWGRYNPVTGADAGGAVSANRRISYLLYQYTQRVYWSLVDAATGSAGDSNPQVQDRDDSASVLTQLQRIRDTSRGWLWLDAGSLGLRNNGAGILSPAPEFAPTLFLRFNAGNTPLSVVPRFLATDNPAEAGLKYTGLKTSFSARALANAITLRVHNANSEAVYGPYTNQDSLTQWGAQSDEVELHELEGWSLYGAAPDPGSAANAGSFLKRYATPQRYPSSVTLNVTEDLTPALDSQPYDALRVKRNAPVGALDSTVRVLKLTHTITADRRRPEKGRWQLQLDTRPIEGTAAVTVTPPDATNSPNGQTSGGNSIDATQPMSRRACVTDQAFAAGSTAAIPWPTPLEVTGIAFDAANRWWTIPKRGRYLITCMALIFGQANQSYGIDVRVNGVVQSRTWGYAGNEAVASVRVCEVITLQPGDHLQTTGIGTAGAFTMSGAGADNRMIASITYLGG